MAPTCSSVTSRLRVSALRMIGSRYRFNIGLALRPVNHRTPLMNTTIDQDSTISRRRVWPGRKRGERKTSSAAAKAPSSADTGHRWLTSARDHSSTRAASARQRISMDRVLRKPVYRGRPAVSAEPVGTLGVFSSWIARLISESAGSADFGSRASSMSGVIPL